MTEVTSVLVPACSAQPQLFTCLAVAGEETVTSQTLVLPAREMEDCQEEQEEPSITTWDSNLLVLLGSRVELRCEELLEGRAKPGVWLGQEDSGDSLGRLVIKKVQWADMGLYTCITHLGTPRTTFLYPLTEE